MTRVRGLLIGYFVIALLTGWPLALAAIAGVVAERNGCTLNEGNIHPCVVNGYDIGHTLYTMGMMPWLMIAFIPIAVVAGFLWTTAWLLLQWRRKRQAASG